MILKKTPKRRAVFAKKALNSTYESDIRDNIFDFLVDVRHLCDAKDLDFAELAGKAYKQYCEEKAR